MYTCTVIAEAFSSAATSMDRPGQAARTPAGRSSPEFMHSVASDAVERHEDDLADEPGDDARAFFGLGAGFFDAPPLGVAPGASCAADMSAVLASPAGGSTPAARTGCSKSMEAQEVCLDWTAELMDAPPPPPAAATSSPPLNSLIQLGQEPLAPPNPTCDTCLTSVGYPTSISCSLCTVNI